jgi:pSer/pThr/pTyr-binding forkhead associated (FHA) protein
MCGIVPLRLEVTALSDPQARVFRYEFDSDRAQILLGRRGGVDVLLPDVRVSLVHARIERYQGEYFLVDNASTNGTRLNGSLLVAGARQLLAESDRIIIGEFALKVALQASVDGRPESSLSLARGMVRELLERLGPGESQPSLEVLDGPQTGVVLPLPDVGRTYILGRAAGNDLRLDDVDMWREHAALERHELGITIRAIAAHPLSVAGERVAGARQLQDGDLIELGATSMRYHDPAEVYLRKLESDNLDEPAAPSAPPSPATAPSRRPDVIRAAFGVVTPQLANAGQMFVIQW